MTTVTLNTYYCTFCDAIDRVFQKSINTCERIGTARAASQLAQLGYYEASRQLMLSINKEEGK